MVITGGKKTDVLVEGSNLDTCGKTAVINCLGFDTVVEAEIYLYDLFAASPRTQLRCTFNVLKR